MGNIGVDCSQWPDEPRCAWKMTGQDNDVVAAAAQHRAEEHQGDAETARTKINSALDDPAQPFAWRI